jgi:hypothetical protein
MWIFLLVLGILTVWGVAAAITVTLRDGYRAVPTCDFEGKRNPG